MVAASYHTGSPFQRKQLLGPRKRTVSLVRIRLHLEFAPKAAGTHRQGRAQPLVWRPRPRSRSSSAVGLVFAIPEGWTGMTGNVAGQREHGTAERGPLRGRGRRGPGWPSTPHPRQGLVTGMASWGSHQG